MNGGMNSTDRNISNFLRTSKEFWTRQRDVECKSGDHAGMKKILKDMGFDRSEIHDAIAIVESYGGYCDCEVMYNSFKRLVSQELEDELYEEWEAA